MNRVNVAPKRRGTKVSIAVTVAVIALIAGAVVSGPFLRTPEQAAAEALPPEARPVLVKAETRRLSERVVIRAAIFPGKSVPMVATAALITKGAVVTDVPLAVGSKLNNGAVVLEANGEPVFAMNWPFRAYRDIRFGDRGPDVAALQSTLASLGYRTSLNSRFDAPTQAGLKQFYTDRGYGAPQENSAEEPADTSTAKAESEKTSSSSSATPSSITKKNAQPQIYFPASHVARISAPSHTITAVETGIGAELSDPTAPLFRLDGGNGFALAAVTSDQAAKLAVGNKAEVKDNRDGQTHGITVTSIAQSSAEVPGVGQGFRVEFSFDGAVPTPTAEGSTLMATVLIGTDLGSVLAVPVSGVFSKADGETFVTVSKGGSTTDIRFEAGKSLGGWIQITPLTTGEVTAGDQLVVGTMPEPKVTP